MKFLVKPEAQWGYLLKKDGQEISKQSSIQSIKLIQASNIDTALTLARLRYGKHIIVTTI